MTDRNHGWSARLTRLLAGAVGGEPNPLSRRPLNQSDDEELANAWKELHHVTPTGWHVEPPTYDPRRRRWEQHAFDMREQLKEGHRTGEWIAISDTEVAVVHEMAKALREISGM